ncbi:Glutamyl-tRNA(Gln) amidotransferase subunit A, chloroplastic/mitochondrial [Apostasia shenzhenica]|uniref:Glutamyl-tRNA(Gln) amidotransferase subunit A, chloroplastic/mitochondrial n=1 Tax=Apostasia shenzhenica TaxID=1088818 RepID=A0A2I0BFA1_9ASPA|nr:Glutamyl-tRNA(Gln) amidotransferase subunit A, chloroplastic/mitochondrial [Apostasia shenzhenica]
MAFPKSCFFLLLQLSAAAAAAAAAAAVVPSFDFKEATIAGIQSAFDEGRLTSVQLVHDYLEQISSYNPRLRAVVELNPDALSDAARADRRRLSGLAVGPLDGVPILLKDNMCTLGRLNTTAGSLALLGSVVPREAAVAILLRRAGAVILGKASMSEWSAFRSVSLPAGWCARSGQGRNPYSADSTPCGSSSGPAIGVAANMAAAALGTEVDGSILCPAGESSVVGIKPTVGLVSRAGILIVSERLEAVGPIARTVADAVVVLDAIVGSDPLAADRTADEVAAAKFIPAGGYRQFLKADGLRGKRVGILRRPFFVYAKRSVEGAAFDRHFRTIRAKGAILVDNLQIENLEVILNAMKSGESADLLAEFKLSINSYLSKLVSSSVRSLADVIAFNKQHIAEERMEFGQNIFLAAENTSGLREAEKMAMEEMARLSAEGLEKVMVENRLDAVVFPEARASPVLAIGGYPGITVPAGYRSSGEPFGICFGGLKGSEPNLIEIAYAFEQATRVRKRPAIM